MTHPPGWRYLLHRYTMTTISTTNPRMANKETTAIPAGVSMNGVSVVTTSALYFSTRIITKFVQLTPV